VIEIGRRGGRCSTREELGLFVKGVALVMVLRCRMMPGEQDSRSEMVIELCGRVDWVGVDAVSWKPCSSQPENDVPVI
jgi:hypothetical protein